jgi:putative transposase
VDTVDRDALAQLLEGPEAQKALDFEVELIALAKRDQEEPRRVNAHVEELAEKLGISARQVYRKRKAYEEHGLWGLVDQRALPLRTPFANLDTRIVVAMQQQAAYETHDSTGTISRFITRVKRRLAQQYGEDAVRLPSDITLRRAAKHLFDPAGTFGSAPRRRSDAGRPQRAYANSPATRPGEVVMLDSTRLDVLALEPVTGKAVAVELTIALDLATRSILAWRVTPAETQAVDAIGLLADMVSPEPMRDGWEETVRFNVLALPVDRLVAVDERLALAAARPVIAPEKLVVDNGKIFVSKAMVGACLRLGIDLQFARLRTATDKPEVERAFGTIRTQFSQHVSGYTGQSVDKRGDRVEAVARWTIEDLEDFFAEYLLYVYQRQPHGGLRLTGRVHVPLSPNDAYAHLIAIHGYVAIPRDPYLFLELLPVVWRKIRPEGVSINKQLFASEVTYRYRSMASPYPQAEGKWPFRVDPRNRLFVYLKDPAGGSWHAIPWVHAHRNARPFGTRTLLMVREFLATRLGKAAVTSEAIGDALEALQARMDAPEAGTAS